MNIDTYIYPDGPAKFAPKDTTVSAVSPQSGRFNDTLVGFLDVGQRYTTYSMRTSPRSAEEILARLSRKPAIDINIYLEQHIEGNEPYIEFINSDTGASIASYPYGGENSVREGIEFIMDMEEGVNG